MSRDDADFAAYLAARWTSMVHAVVLLTGLPRRDAEARVLDGFARCHPAWARIRSEDDVDTQVWEAVDREAPPEPAPAPDPDRDPALLALVAELDRLGPADRDVLVLTHVAGLDEVQIAELLDVSIAEVASRGREVRARLDLSAVRTALGRDDLSLSTAETLRLAAQTIETGAAPYDGVLARARDHRRRRTRLVTIGVVAALVVVGGLTWAGARTGGAPPDDDDLGSVPVTGERNPVDLPWFADGVLHLDDVTLELPHLTDLVEVPSGAVYADTHGEVAYVDTHGDRRLLGHIADASPLVGSREIGWVAWVDRDAGLVVDDVAGGVATSLPGRPQHDAVPVAIDGDTVYYRLDGQTYWWKPREQVIGSQPFLRLLDLSTSTKVYQTGRKIDVVQPIFGVDYRRPGLGAQVSGGGIYVLTQEPGDSLPLGAFEPALYNVRTGTRIPTGLGPGEVALDAAFADGSSVVYLVAQVADLEQAVSAGADEPLGTLRTCQINDRCTDIAPVRLGGGEPLLAH